MYKSLVSRVIERNGTWLPIEVYKAVRPYIEEVAEREGRPISYDELAEHLFDLLGRKALTRAQIGGHIGRSKKLMRFKVGRAIYVVWKKNYDKFMRGTEFVSSTAEQPNVVVARRGEI